MSKCVSRVCIISPFYFHLVLYQNATNNLYTISIIIIIMYMYNYMYVYICYVYVCIVMCDGGRTVIILCSCVRVLSSLDNNSNY